MGCLDLHEQQWMPKGRQKLLVCLQLHHQGKCWYMMVITTASSQAFPESCTTDNCWSKCLNNGSCWTQVVHMDNTDGFSAVFKKCKGPLPLLPPLSPPSAMTKCKQPAVYTIWIFIYVKKLVNSLHGKVWCTSDTHIINSAETESTGWQQLYSHNTPCIQKDCIHGQLKSEQSMCISHSHPDSI